jgi:hypothetical protein
MEWTEGGFPAIVRNTLPFSKYDIYKLPCEGGIYMKIYKAMA